MAKKTYWKLENRAGQTVLIHFCLHASKKTTEQTALHQDIGGGYVRCQLCGEKFLPPHHPGNPRLMLRLLPDTDEDNADGEPTPEREVSSV